MKIQKGGNKSLPQAEKYRGHYLMHKYWSKKPHNIFVYLLEQYSRPGDTVLDPFCGSGVSIFEGWIRGRKMIGLDLNPMAIFLTQILCKFVDLDLFQQAFIQLKDTCLPQILKYYTTSCPTCGKTAFGTHYLWNNGSCTLIKFRCQNCGQREKLPDKEDLKLITEIKKSSIARWYPDYDLVENSRLCISKPMKVKDFFTKRNLICLTILFEQIQQIADESIRELMQFVFTGSLSQTSKMVFAIKQRNKLKKSTPSSPSKVEVGSWVAGFWIPQEHFEINVWNCFEQRYKKVIRGKKQTNKLVQASSPSLNALKIHAGSATDLSFIPDLSVDFVLTDPPYGDSVPFLELSQLWASWLDFPLDFEREIIISNSRQRNKNFKRYKEELETAFHEIFKKVKKGGYLCLTFNNLKGNTWNAILSACLSAGFVFQDVTSFRSSAGSVIQDSRVNALKADVLLTFKKPEENNQSITLKISNEVQIVELIVKTLTQILKDHPQGLTTTDIVRIIIETLIKQQIFNEKIDFLQILKTNFQQQKGRWRTI
ncbi:MAG: DNA methyltransferase [Promethearchaeota archaeon]